MKINVEYQQKKEDHNSVLKEYYARYLIEVRGLKMSSVKHYFDALNNISRHLKEMGLVQKDIYEIADLDRLKSIKEVLYSDQDFVAQDERGRRMYSAGLNNYCRFASGEGFDKIQNEMGALDIPIAPEAAIFVEQKVWKRSGILRAQAIELAGYSCELNHDHQSFISGTTYKPYMEGHHAIPMNAQDRFSSSLDVYANIICLCPLCHRKIHYGVKDERVQMIKHIYDMRSKRLDMSGLQISKADFVDMAIG